MSQFELFKTLIENSSQDTELLQTLYNLLLMEINVTTATSVLRKDFNNEFAQKTVVEKFFFPYEMMTPGDQEVFYMELPADKKKMLDAWKFAKDLNYPYKAEVAGMYMASIAGQTDEQIDQHLVEAKTLFSFVQLKLDALKIAP